MIIQIEIPDDAIKQEEDLYPDDLIDVIESGFYYMMRVTCYHHIEDSEIKFSIVK